MFLAQCLIARDSSRRGKKWEQADQVTRLDVQGLDFILQWITGFLEIQLTTPSPICRLLRKHVSNIPPGSVNYKCRWGIVFPNIFLNFSKELFNRKLKSMMLPNLLTLMYQTPNGKVVIFTYLPCLTGVTDAYTLMPVERTVTDARS